jgi:hypothetical protein
MCSEAEHILLGNIPDSQASFPQGVACAATQGCLCKGVTLLAFLFCLPSERLHLLDFADRVLVPP